MFNYSTHTLRNIDYVGLELQEEIRNTTVLVAGCGIGSSFAEAAVRLGFTKFIIVDGDIVSAHNLNRQCYDFADIGSNKAQALKSRLLRINPTAQVEAIDQHLVAANVEEIVSRVDVVFDTIDFLDLVAITALHDEAKRQGKLCITALAIGWGAGCVVFPQKGEPDFRKWFGLPPSGPLRNESYVEHFSRLIDPLVGKLDEKVIAAVRNALRIMADGTPCPASQVAAGASSVAALSTTLLVKILAKEDVPVSPNLICVDLYSLKLWLIT